MKQIIPFQKELLFKTKVSEITSISLEHTLSLTNDDTITGSFHISGDYKMTEGSINREKFNFELPFEITLNDKYVKDKMIIDIDNFYYELVNNESLKVNIDVYIEGEQQKEEPVIIEEKEERKEEPEVEEKKEHIEETREIINNEIEEKIKDIEELDESVQFQKKDKYYLEEDEKDPEFNLFDNMDNSDTYVTYHVYIVKEGDTLDKIIEKFGVTTEDISLYNNLEELKTGTKLIIPNKNE